MGENWYTSRMRVPPCAARRRVGRHRFRLAVQQALESLPEGIEQRLDNVVVTVEDEPERAGSETIFGIYEGIPLTERTSGYGMVTPDRIVIFQGPLERSFPNRRELVEQIRVTVLHELGHHLGFDEDRLDEIGLG